ncbi:unnamed protein product [Macrosiphum euphorbiae]|uniref:Uncharacterized protein n=1 Tax=Macrosiphum euphorbiae TaxID=13131 RepID=A0AAV0XM80_9HEMI|nr:unnamed protein product [Macrosiphum euphorbiae]
MNADQTQSISSEREAMMNVFSELRAAKFRFPREWEVPNGEHDPAPGFVAQHQWTQVRDTDKDIAADRQMQRSYVSDAEILGVQDWLGKPPAPTLQVYTER